MRRKEIYARQYSGPNINENEDKKSWEIISARIYVT
jgi:hypothetical protein